ncbi:MAG: asparagine synthase (glutamine-hydrolyzing) [Pseudomonadota bacterium]
MCGILGICGVTPDLAIDETRFLAARDIMRSRGPDAAGFARYEGVAGEDVLFGHRRLSIQDLSPSGNQPMISACGRYAIIYNGEVYNTPTLRANLKADGHRFRSGSDTEAILEGYARRGPDIVGELHGIFVFAIWDRMERKLFVARDRIGIKPLYWAEEGGSLAFASDARALRALGYGGARDEDALALYFSFGYVPAPRSIWKGIAKLDAGGTLEWRPGRAPVIRTYWSAPEETDYAENSVVLEALIDSVVEEQLLSDVPVGLFLSGGLDSSVVAASIAALGSAGRGVTALTVGFPGRADADEAPIAERTARTLGLSLEILPLSKNARDYYREAVVALDEPLAYSAIVTQTAISRLAAEAGLKVVLSGDGGDEVFGGYRWYERLLDPPPPPRNPFEHILPKHRRRAAEAARDRAWRALSPVIAHAQSVFPGFRADQTAALLGRSEAEIRDLAIAALARHDRPALPEKRRRQRLDLYTFCQDVVLTKVDRAGMAFGVEARPPLLDHRIIDWGLSRPVSEDFDARPKNALREIVRARGLGFLLDQPKRGFSLKSSDAPTRERMAADITADAADLGIARDWQTHMPRGMRHYGPRLALLHWLVLWNRAISS